MATSNFTFTTLTGTETAGWNSINTLITSIDTQLNASNRLINMSAGTPSDGQSIVWSSANSRWQTGALTGAAIANNAVALGTQTTGDYVASVSAAGTNEVSVAGSGEGAAATVRLADNTALRGQATVETPPSYTAAQTGATGRIPDARYVTDALAYATSGNVTLSGDVTGNASANTIANNAVTQAKMADNSVGTAEIIDSNVTYAKLGDDVKYYQTAVVVTTSGASARTFSLTDSNRKFIEYNVATTGGTFTVPPSSSVNFPVGAEIHLLQTNTGQLTIAAGAGVTINATPGLKLRTQWSSATLIKRAADTWVLVGDLVA